MTDLLLGLRIDADTLRGTRLGVPALCETLGRRGIRGSFFLCAGPDNMGRHLWRLLKPAFLKKILRGGGARLYGWDIMLMGTCWPGPKIGPRAAGALRRVAAEGHEVGVHAWDHHGWQAHAERWDEARARAEIGRCHKALARLCGAAPIASASPAWRCPDAALAAKAGFGYRYNSDCRGVSVFRPGGEPGEPPQVPTTLPTYDEIIGAVGEREYNAHILGLLRPGDLNVLTIHAEAEGIACLALFEDFLDRCAARGVRIVPLGDLVPAGPVPAGRVMRAAGVPGREGWISVQEGG